MIPENKNVRMSSYVDHEGKIRKEVPYSFSFGNIEGDAKQYFPHTWSLTAKFLKVCQLLNGAPRSFFHDSCCVSNLTKSGLLVRRGKKMYPTKRGLYYLKTRTVDVDVKEWLMTNSWLRYAKLGGLMDTVIVLQIGGGQYDKVAETFEKARRENRADRSVHHIMEWIRCYHAATIESDKASHLKRIRRYDKKHIKAAAIKLKETK